MNKRLTKYELCGIITMTNKKNSDRLHKENGITAQSGGIRMRK